MNEKKIDIIKSKKQPFAIGDILVFAAVVLLAVTLVLTLTGKKGSGVEIICDGVRVVMPLDTYSVRQVGGHLTVEIKDGKCRVTQSDCRNRTCVNTGEISRVGESIVCAQNKIAITVIGDDGLAGIVGKG